MQKHASQKKRQGKRLLPWLILVVIIFIVGLVVGTLQIMDTPEPKQAAVPSEPQATREVILYFASEDAQSLRAETRLINECPVDEDCLRDTVQALIAGPQSDLVPILPAQVRLRNVAIVDSLVQVDFSREMVAAHPGGTQSELLTVYGLTDTLAVNFPHIRQVQILVDGTPVSTLKGHVDLRQPTYPDFSFVEEDAATVGETIPLPVGSEE